MRAPVCYALDIMHISLRSLSRLSLFAATLTLGCPALFAADHEEPTVVTKPSSSPAEEAAPAKTSPVVKKKAAPAEPLTPDSALAKLVAGNARYAKGNVIHPHQSVSRRTEVASQGQKPFAIVVGCSDSRTSPEIVFDQGLGDIFVTRLAGNIVDKAALGSIEYAIAHFGSAVIVVLGHEKCGAVDAAMQGGKAPGQIGAVVKPILPAVAAAKKAGHDTLDGAIEENAHLIATGLPGRSKILSDAIKEGKLKIVSAYYDLHTGRVKLLP
jgi:carbonic anhydrase